MVDGLEKRYASQIEFRNYNVKTDLRARAYSKTLGITGIPAFVFADKNGAITALVLGPMTAQSFEQRLQALAR